jgi:hypothetical protein
MVDVRLRLYESGGLVRISGYERGESNQGVEKWV